jgi:predicted flap endonuclease-1-like 5' DNA nuclease
MTKAVYYIGIERSVDLRRDILESAKHSVAVLQAKKRINELRIERHTKVTELRALMTGMHERLEELDKMLPSHSKRKLPKAVAQLEKRIKEKKAHEKKLTINKHPAKIGDIKGVGPAREKKLKKAGYTSLEKIAEASVKEIHKKTNIDAGFINKIITEAQRITGIVSKNKPEFDEMQEKNLDEATKISNENTRLESDISELEDKLSEIERKLNNL